MSHADHEWAREQLAAHLAGGLPADERARLETHAATCAECIAEIDALRRFDRSMEEMFAPIRPKPGLEERVIRGLRHQPEQKPAPMAKRIAYAVAAIFLMGLVGFAVLNFSESEAGPEYLASVRAKMVANSGVQDGEARMLEQVGMDFRDVAGKSASKSRDPVRLASAGEMARASLDESRKNLSITGFGGRGPLTGATFKSEEADHNETADKDDFKQAKGDSLDFVSSAPFKGKGTYDRINVPRPSPAPMAPPPAAPAEGAFAMRNSGPAGADPGFFRPGDVAPAQPTDLALLANKMSDVDKETWKELISKRKPKGIAELEETKEERRQDQPNAAPQQARKIIRSGEMEFEIEAFDSAVAKIDAIAAEEQGVIATVNSEKLPNGKVRGSVVIRVPPERLSTLIIKLRALGDLKSQRLGSEDITKQYTDLESRLRAARTMEERLLRIIKEGKGEIKDLLLAEKELGEWRTKIEVAEGEKRYYDNLVSLSTLTITLFEKEIRAAFGVTETERVDAGVEVEEVEKAYKDLLAAVVEAKGRVTKSDLKKLAAGQFTATVHFEVSPDASGPLRDRLKQLGNVARLDVNVAQQAEGGRSPTPDVKVKRNDAQFFVSIYNLANVSPRETVHLSLACVKVETSYQAVLARVEKAAGRIKTSRRDQQSATLDFEVKAAEAILEDLKAQGEVMILQVTENSDLANVTRSKKGYMVTFASLTTTQARETTTIQLAAKDVAAAYAALSEAVRKAEGRVFQANLNETDRRNVSAMLSFDVRRDALKGIDEALKAGEVYTRASNRLQDAQNVVDSKVRMDLTIFPIENVPPRESVTLAVDVNDVAQALEALHAILADVKGRIKDARHTSSPGGQKISKATVDVPFKQVRAVEERIKRLGHTMVSDSRPNPAVPDSEMSVARFEVTLSNDLIVPTDSAPWASIKKGFSVSALALSWSLTLVMIGLCFVLPLALIAWGGWKVTKMAKGAKKAV